MADGQINLHDDKSANGYGSAWDVREIKADSLNAVKSILPGDENHTLNIMDG